MSALYFDRVQETSITTGLTDFLLGGAVAGFQRWAVVGDTNTAYYAAAGVDSQGAPTGEWEVGLGTYSATGPVLARTTVLASSNANAKVVFSPGTKRVMLVIPASVFTTIAGLIGGALPLLTADPASPVNDTWWAVRTGSSPTQTVSIKVRIGGVTSTVASITQ
jgi:hypothetical protein